MPSFPRLLLFLCLTTPATLVAQATCLAATGPAADPTYPLRVAAFAAIQGHDPVSARHLMRCAIIGNPQDKIALRQEVYLDLSAGNATDALADIEALRALGEIDPQLEAQEGYLFAEQKNFPAAKSAFRRAYETGDQALRLQSLTALHNLRSASANTPTLSLAVDSAYLNRFTDGIVDASARLSQRLGAHSPVEAFLDLRLLRDTASRVTGRLPQIFDDNAFMPGVGLAFAPHATHLSLTAEASEAYVFYAGRNHTPALVPDYRVVAGYFNIFRPHPGARLSDRFALEANASFGFYSRYQHDAIAYLQPQESFDLIRGSSDHLRLTAYLQQSLALDTNRQFYNNLFELIPGLALTLPRSPGLALRTEYVRGFYLPASATSINPYAARYNDFRFRLVWQKSLALGRGGD